MDKLVDHLFVFDGEGEVRDFPGNYTQYRIEEDARAKPGGKNEKGSGSSLNVQTPPPAPVAAPVVEVKAAEKKKPSFKDKREFELLEKEMPELEREKQTLSDKMNAGALPYTDLEAAAKRIGEINSLLEAKELRWLELSEMM
jgi:ATP-binding cassette subfamily F protein uup